jgi:hypothetical protein
MFVKKVSKNCKQNLEINFLVYSNITKKAYDKKEGLKEEGLRCSPGNEEDPDGQEEEEKKGEDDSDVGPGPEPQHTQQQQLHHLAQ